MKQATLVEIAESCKVTRGAAQHWAIKAGEKISSIKRKLAEARPYHPAIFNEDEIVCIVGAHLEIMGDFTEATLQDPIEKTPQDPMEKLRQILLKNSIGSDGKKIPTDSEENAYGFVTKPSLDQKMAVIHEVRKLAELFERTTPGASADYCLNWAKKRLSGRGNGDKYQPTMNLIEQDNPGENNNG